MKDREKIAWDYVQLLQAYLGRELSDEETRIIAQILRMIYADGYEDGVQAVLDRLAEATREHVMTQ